MIAYQSHGLWQTKDASPALLKCKSRLVFPYLLLCAVMVPSPVPRSLGDDVELPIQSYDRITLPQASPRIALSHCHPQQGTS